MDVAEIVSILSDLCIGGAAVITAVVARRGVESWKAELRGKADFEVARGFIKATYRLRDEIAFCRRPHIMTNEYPEEYLNKPAAQRTTTDEGDAIAYVYKNRLHGVNECVVDFDAASLEAEALWGSDIRDKADPLLHLIRVLQKGIDAVVGDAYSDSETFYLGDDKKKDVMTVVKDSRENRFTWDINRTVRNIESVVRPLLSRKK